MAPARYWSSCVITTTTILQRYVHFSGALGHKNTKENLAPPLCERWLAGANEVTWRLFGKQRKTRDKWNLIAVGTTWCCGRWPNKHISGTLFLNWPSGHHTNVKLENLLTPKAGERHLWVIVLFEPSFSDVHQPKGDVLLLSINVVLYLLFFLRLNC